MRNLYCLLVYLFSCSLYAQSRDTLQAKILQPAAMQADFRYLRRLLEETHPGLYRYTPKPVMQAKLDSLATTLSEPLPFYEFYRTIEGLVADIRCAHTYALPTKNFESALMTYWKTFPFFMLPIQDRLYVLFNGTTDTTVKPGFELLSINGKTMATVRQQVQRYHWADGAIQSSKQAVAKGALFGLFYYWFVERSSTFRLKFRSLTGDTIHIDAPAQSFTGSVKAWKKNPVNRQMMAWYIKKPMKKPWRLTFPDDTPQTGLLRFDSFGGKGVTNGATAITTFQKFMDASMARLEKAKIRNLIIDVRGNPGGWDSQGIELLTYLLKSDSAVTYYTRQHSVTDSSEFVRFSDLSEADRQNVKNELIPEVDGTFTLKQGSDSREPKRYTPKPNRFRGNVYILMDGNSASTTSEFLAVAHTNRVGVFVGEESGGAYEGGNGSSFIHLELPHSQIHVGTPLVYYNNAVQKVLPEGRGTMPDFAVSIGMDDVLTHKDSQLNYVKTLIRQQRN
ncbi:S41 family peptidase [Spirosoma validum]|uniref:Peptidase S41 n=1 Tax=Spirosoma validum TaxID=2771355 RepID=A0A927GBN2_9BACT|nr:S41 family peptidase [Spirosoma validum]MBD2751779.1 peptidase S41 [Spirosoma validum]